MVCVANCEGKIKFSGQRFLYDVRRTSGGMFVAIVRSLVRRDLPLYTLWAVGGDGVPSLAVVLRLHRPWAGVMAVSFVGRCRPV